jgi:peptidoglycan/xylan/chitin deacetylase (PgdA/CDA1 family)
MFSHTRFRLRAIVATAVVLAGSLTAVSSASATLYPAGPPRYPSFVTTMCPAEPTGPLENAPNAIEGGRTVALTFDDGPGPSVPAIMQVLQHFHIRATFLNDDTHWPSYLTQEYNAGYLMGNHTGNHHLLTGLSLGLQLAEIDRVILKTYAVTKTAACVFRPPYGGFDNVTIQAAAQRRVGMWMWNDGTGDFLAQGSDSPYWIRHIWASAISVGLRIAHPTILMHDQHHPMPATVDALPIMIQRFLNRGYTFVDLLGRSGPPNTCPGTAPAPYGTNGTPLAAGSNLASGDSLVSPNGEFTLTMTTSGNLTMSLTGGRTLWSTGTGGHPGADAEMGNDGILRVVDGGNTVWSSGATSGATQAMVGDNGNLVTMKAGGATWSSNSILTELHHGDRLRSGWSVYSPSGLCAMTQMPSGALTLHSPNGMVIWTNNVQSANAQTTMTVGGSLVTTHDGSAVWSSQMPHANDRMVITDTGHAAFYAAGGTLFFTTP